MLSRILRYFSPDNLKKMRPWLVVWPTVFLCLCGVGCTIVRDIPVAISLSLQIYDHTFSISSLYKHLQSSFMMCVYQMSTKVNTAMQDTVIVARADRSVKGIAFFTWAMGREWLIFQNVWRELEYFIVLWNDSQLRQRVRNCENIVRECCFQLHRCIFQYFCALAQ